MILFPVFVVLAQALVLPGQVAVARVRADLAQARLVVARERRLAADAGVQRLEAVRMGFSACKVLGDWVVLDGFLTEYGAARMGVLPQHQRCMVATQSVDGGWTLGIRRVAGEGRCRWYVQGPVLLKPGKAVPYTFFKDGKWFGGTGRVQPDGTVELNQMMPDEVLRLRFGPREVQFSMKAARLLEQLLDLLQGVGEEDAGGVEAEKVHPAPPPALR